MRLVSENLRGINTIISLEIATSESVNRRYIMYDTNATNYALAQEKSNTAVSGFALSIIAPWMLHVVEHCMVGQVIFNRLMNPL